MKDISIDDAMSVLSNAKREDIEAHIDDLDGYDSRIAAMQSLHEATAHAASRIKEDLEGELHDYEKHAFKAFHCELFDEAHEHYEYALLTLAQIYSVDSYVQHHRIIRDSAALALARKVIAEITSDEKHGKLIDTPDKYERAVHAVCEAFDDLD